MGKSCELLIWGNKYNGERERLEPSFINVFTSHYADELWLHGSKPLVLVK